jgi:hypothetical protein
MHDEAVNNGPRASRRSDGVIMCSCGDRLADRIDGDVVIIDGMEFRFRRRNDHMTCRKCGFSHPMRALRFGEVPVVRHDTGERRRQSDRVDRSRRDAR